MFCTPPATTRSGGAAEHRLRGEVHGLLGRAALPVHGDAGHRLGQARREPRGAGDVAGLRADRVHAAEHHVVDGARVGLGAGQQGRDDVRAQVGRVQRLARPPPRRVTGVRTASIMKASGIAASPV